MNLTSYSVPIPSEPISSTIVRKPGNRVWKQMKKQLGVLFAASHSKTPLVTTFSPAPLPIYPLVFTSVPMPSSQSISPLQSPNLSPSPSTPRSQTLQFHLTRPSVHTQGKTQFYQAQATIIKNESFVCEHCGTTTTPERRTGPSGKKTLCNACGLRWAKSQRNGNNSNEGSITSSNRSTKMPRVTEQITNTHSSTTSTTTTSATVTFTEQRKKRKMSITFLLNQEESN